VKYVFLFKKMILVEIYTINNNVALRQDSGHVTFYFRIPLCPQHIE
jgi:hypothetical protein